MYVIRKFERKDADYTNCVIALDLIGYYNCASYAHLHGLSVARYGSRGCRLDGHDDKKFLWNFYLNAIYVCSFIAIGSKRNVSKEKKELKFQTQTVLLSIVSVSLKVGVSKYLKKKKRKLESFI
ncbi:hypothetical protein EDC96DRAFT_544025 [Choanephora cucurbitarum]|nr:hypothetical protein EDC96DRAFT_544025 [Choanephora cucurbitarum]